MATEKRARQRANRELKNQQQAKVQHRQRLTRRVLIGAGAVVGGLALVLFLAWAFGSDSDDADDTPVTTLPALTETTTASTGTAPGSTTPAEPEAFAYGTGACPPEQVDEPVKDFDDAPQLCIDESAGYTARFVTNQGDIVVDLATDTAPGTVNNFVTLARYGYYDGTPIFRADPSIDIIQGGGENNTDDPGYTIPDEGSGFTYQPGDLAMANTGQPDSGSAQWFFVAGPNGSNLDALGSYVKFGTITEGLDVAEAILALSGPDGQTPTEDVILERVEITET